MHHYIEKTHGLLCRFNLSPNVLCTSEIIMLCHCHCHCHCPPNFHLGNKNDCQIASRSYSKVRRMPMDFLEHSRLSAIWTKAVATVRQCSIFKVVYLVFINLASFHSVSRNLDFKLPIPHLSLPQPSPAVVPHPCIS